MQFEAMPYPQAENFDERTVVREILYGDTEAFRQIIQQYQKLVNHIVFRMVSHGTDREELCQEIFIKVYRHLASFKFQSKLSTWIGRIAYNACINFLKKRKALLFSDIFFKQAANEDSGNSDGAQTYYSEELAGKPQTQDSEMQAGELQSIIEDEIAKLPSQYRALVTLFHLDELSLKEISEIMGMPEGTAKNYLFRARKILKRRLMEKYQPEELCL